MWEVLCWLLMLQCIELKILADFLHLRFSFWCVLAQFANLIYNNNYNNNNSNNNILLLMPNGLVNCAPHLKELLCFKFRVDKNHDLKKNKKVGFFYLNLTFKI